MRINKFKLEKTAITTYNHVGFVWEVDNSTDKVEYNKTSTSNIPHINKKGNFPEWEFLIVRTHETDSEWTAIKDGLNNFDGLTMITCTFDTVDNPSETRKITFWCEPDDINNYDIEEIYCKFISVYSDGNEV